MQKSNTILFGARVDVWHKISSEQIFLVMCNDKFFVLAK